MNVARALIISFIAWLGAFVLTNFNPYMLLMAPFVISALTLICCLAPTRKCVRQVFDPLFPVPPGKP